jgi:hypothetical protein
VTGLRLLSGASDCRHLGIAPDELRESAPRRTLQTRAQRPQPDDLEHVDRFRQAFDPRRSHRFEREVAFAQLARRFGDRDRSNRRLRNSLYGSEFPPRRLIPMTKNGCENSARARMTAATRRMAYFVSSVRSPDGRKHPRRSAASTCPPPLSTGGPTVVSGRKRPWISDVSLRIPNSTSIRAWAMKSLSRSGTNSRQLSCGPLRAPDE